jgi:hypothetical protein
MTNTKYRTAVHDNVPGLRTFRRRLRHGLGAGGFLALGFLQPGIAAASAAESDAVCQEAAITGESWVDSATGAFIGSGALALDGIVTGIQWVSVITSTESAPDGTLTLTSSHHITGNGIDFTTSDVVTAVPTDVSGVDVFSSHLTLVSGVGRVKHGFLDVHGRVDFSHGHVIVESSSGSLCHDE